VEAGSRKRIAEVVSGGSYFSQNSLTLYFGLENRRRRIGSKCAGRRARRRRGANRTIGSTEGSETVASHAWVKR